MQFKKIISALVLASLVAPQVCFAQDKVPSPDAEPKKSFGELVPPVRLAPGEEDPGKALSPMRKGQKAPFTGVLLAPASVADIIVDTETIEERIHIEVTRAMQEEQAKCDKKVSDLDARLTADKKVLQASVDGRLREINILNVELKKSQSFIRNPVLWGGVGFVVGVGLSAAGVYAITRASK